MIKKIFILFLIGLLLPCLAYSQQGKVRGLVKDKETGEPLIGANVILEGTSLGGAADLNGEYVVLGVPPGTYTIRADYIGYQSLSISNVRVSADLTTTLDFTLSSTALEMEAVQVVAERPLIQRNTTNTVRMTTQEDIQNLPVRGLQNLIALEAGVVQQNGEIHIRGGRTGEVAYFVDGVTASNPYNNEENITVIQEATEEIQMQAGGYTAETSGGNSGVVRSTLRTGGANYNATIDYRTDDFTHAGNQFLGTNSYGYRNAVLTLSGPVPGVKKLRFFVAGQHNYMRNDNPTFITPFAFTGLTDDGFTSRPVGEMLPDNGTVSWKQNYLPHNYRQDNMIQGTLTYDMTDNIKLRYSGTYQDLKHPFRSDNFFEALYYYYRNDRIPIRTEKKLMSSLRLTHLLSPTTYYDVNIYYTRRAYKSYDPLFGDDWVAANDSIANANKGFDTSSWISRWRGPLNYSTIYGFEFSPIGDPYDEYDKQIHTNIGFSGNFSTQLNKNWELLVGGRYDMWTLRRYNILNASQLLDEEYGPHGNTPASFASDYERSVRLRKAGDTTIYGYDIDGNEINSGVYGPNKPVFASAYIQNKFEYRDLILNIGFRYERVDLKALTVANPENPKMDTKLDWLDPTGVSRTDAYNYILPRLNFSFPVTESTVFYALYGKFIQMPDLNLVYRGYQYLSQTLSPETRSPYGYWTSYVGYTAEPEETVEYEMGFRQSLTENFAFTMTGFYKNYNNLLRIDKIYSQGLGDIAEGNVLMSGYRNNDFSTVKGVELTLELRRTQRLQARVNYTFSSANGTNSSPRSGEVAVSDDIMARYPLLMSPLDYHQPHRGSVILDYRFGKGDGGKILEGMGFNMLMTFTSGHAYTKIQEPINLGQADPWTIGTDNLTDPRNRMPEEPINRSLTPWNFNVDLNVDKVFFFDRFNVDLYVNVLNLFNTKNIVNVFPNTGTPNEDGWLRSSHATAFFGIPNYLDFYRTINYDNRWAYLRATGDDIYGPPRQIRLGLRLQIK